MRLAILAMFGITSPLTAQLPDFGRPVWTSPVEFTFVGAIRELSDGRLLVADLGERTIHLLGPTGAPIRTVGRVGGGPKEFRAPAYLLAAPGDTTLVVDRDQARLLVIGPDAEPLHTVPWPAAPRGIHGQVTMDPLGRVLFAADPLPPPGRSTSPLLRWDRGTGRIDTVTTLRMQESVRRQVQMQGREAIVTRALPYSPEDGWASGPTGIAIVRGDRYALEWFPKEGSSTQGPAIPYAAVPVTERERTPHLDGLAPEFRELMRFPDHLPATDASSVRLSPTGETWARLQAPAGAHVRIWHVIDRLGQRVRAIAIGADRRIIGFGAHTVLVVRTDENDIEWLEAYR